MTDKDLIPYAPLPTICADCANQVIADATENPKQEYVTVYCPHQHTVLTAQTAELDGQRVIANWTASGPVSAEQAMAMIEQAGRSMGASMVVNRDSQRVH